MINVEIICPKCSHRTPILVKPIINEDENLCLVDDFGYSDSLIFNDRRDINVFSMVCPSCKHTIELGRGGVDGI